MADRDSRGRFVKGHRPINTHNNPGRPKKKTEEKYLKWMSARVKKADWDTIVDAAISRAMSGDNVARQWLSDYLMGKPKQQLAVEGDVGFRFPDIVEVRIREIGDQPPPGSE